MIARLFAAMVAIGAAIVPAMAQQSAQTPDRTGDLTAAENKAIAYKLWTCWTTDPGHLDLEKMTLMLLVTFDSKGRFYSIEVDPSERSRLAADPALTTFAMRAALNISGCAGIPIPQRLRGQFFVLTLRYHPGAGP